ncbi:hypothetical protein J6590_018570 [Homalodisca vitripennis]|nr:hypothetical protein J6590_018570 [Homalodisca vitripennis]
MTSSYSYWKIRGVPYSKPSFPFGNLGDILKGKISLADFLNLQYKMFENERFFGIFHFNTPVLVLKDSSLIENVLMKDFASFCDKVKNSPPKSDIFAFHLGNIKGHKWRSLRQKLNGAFSNNKLKCMTQQILDCGDSLVQQLKPYAETKGITQVDCIGFIYSQKVLGTCVFGIEPDGATIESFVKHAKQYLFGMRVVNMINLWHVYVPRFARILYFVPQIAKVVDYFKNFTLAIIQVRQSTTAKRNDFLQILLDLNDEEVDVGATQQQSKDILENLSSNVSKKEQFQKRDSIKEKPFLSNCDITSQMFNFMSLGLDSIAISIGFLLYDLASNPEEQLKVQQEIDDVINTFGELNYEALHQLEYLDCVIQESTRLRTTFPFTMRVCQASYRIPNSDLVLEKGTMVLIPIYSIHMDPNNYPDPEIFNPNRFKDNHFKSCPKYLPFGAGPRICIAFKLAVLQIKVAIAKLMLNYSVSLNSKTELPVRFAPRFTTKSLNGVWVDFESRKG